MAQQRPTDYIGNFSNSRDISRQTSVDWQPFFAAALVMLVDGVFLSTGMAALWLFQAVASTATLTEPSAAYSGQAVVATYAILTVALMFAARMYSPNRQRSLRRELWLTGVVTTVSALIAGAFLSAAAPAEFQLLDGILLWASATTALLIGRLLIASARLVGGADGKNSHPILVIGSGPTSARAIASLRKNKDAGRIAGCITDGHQRPSRTNAMGSPVLPVLGTVWNLRAALAKFEPGEIIIAVPPARQMSMFEQVQEQLPPGWTVRIPIDLPADEISAPRLNHSGGITTVDVRMQTFPWHYEVTKRVIDFAASIAALAIWLPAMAVIAIAIKLDSPGPVFFRQIRVGRNGKPIQIYKFRSMRQDAEKMKQELMDQNQADGLIFKIKDDPRITRVGKFLRRSSLDELPQLLNVLNGTMSLVGPRPPLPEEVEKYAPSDLFRLRAIPGITGHWQVERSAEPSFSEMVSLDREYIEQWSVIKDIQIMMKTVLVMFGSRGAY